MLGSVYTVEGKKLRPVFAEGAGARSNRLLISSGLFEMEPGAGSSHKAYSCLTNYREQL